MTVEDITKNTEPSSQGSPYIDPLLNCLVIISKLNHRPYSAEALRAGLPLENNLVTPRVLIRAAERAGFSSRLSKKSLEKISNLLLPAILLLKNGQACVLVKITKDNIAEVILPENPEGISRISLHQLEQDYQGEIILLKPVIEMETRANKPSGTTEEKSWFFSTLWRYRYIYSQVIIAALFINIFTLVGPLFIMNVYDRVVPNYAETTLWVLAIGVFIIFTFDFVLRLLRGYMIDVCGKKADILMSSAIFQHVLGMQLINKPASVGAFANNLREFESLRDFYTSATLTTIIDLPFSILFILLIWYLGGYIVLVPLLAVPVVLVSAILIEKPLNKEVKLNMQSMTQKNAVIVEAISALETIKSLSAEGKLQRKWEDSVAHSAKHGLAMRFLSSLINTISNYSQQMVLVGTMVLGVYLIHANLLTVGGLIACNILANRVIAPLAQMASLLTRYDQAKIALEALNKIMALPLEKPPGQRFIHQPKINGEIEFDNVSFQYPGQKNLCLDKVSFKIKPGEHVGIIGKIGSGKTTLQKLILGLYQPQSGNILIDKLDIKQIDPADLRKNIAYIPQDTTLFFGNVRENIALSMPWADDETILKAAQIAGVDNFVNRHPSGYNLTIGERGEGLSGGQRQAIAVARALVSNAPICLFDEPTSSMDNNTERDLLIKLTEYLPQKTLILVTHKVSLFHLVDRLILIDNGKILLDGPKDQVLARLTQPAKPK